MPSSDEPSPAPIGPLEVLLPARGQPEYPLPPELKTLYGGAFGLPPALVYSNFVTSLDGVAVVGPSSGSKLSGQSQTDRFVMGLLRAGAEAILIGSGTLAGSPGHTWSAEHVFPAGKAAFRQLRGQLDRAEFPVLVVVSGSGAIDLDHPGLRRPALILTSDQGRRRLGDATHHQVVSLGPDIDLDPGKIVAAVRQAGHQVILTEGGPQLMGQLLQARQLNQLFLTLSPRLAGRPHGENRAGFVAGVDLLREEADDDLTLLSVHRHISHLFLRYLVEPTESHALSPRASLS